MAADETLAAGAAGRLIYVPPGAGSAEVAARLGMGAKPVKATAAGGVRRRKAAVVAVPVKPAGPHAVLAADGRPVMSVALEGELARGRRFVLDLLAYDRVALLLGTSWVAREPTGASGPAYVVSGRLNARATARAGSIVRLARWLVGAAPGTVVCYLNGNTLDLTRRNLDVVDRAEFWGRLTPGPHDARVQA